MPSLKILALADLHYVCRARECVPAAGDKLRTFGLEWLVRAMRHAAICDRPDVVVLLGDFVQDGLAPAADEDLKNLAAALRAAQIPYVVVPGNHDRDPEAVLKTFGDRAGAHEVKGYTLYSFVDVYDHDDVCTRPQGDIETFLDTVGEGPVVALQHNPIYPDLDCSEYPYMPANNDAIRESFERANVLLSLSGHYHPGQSPTLRNGVTYLACAALGYAPFSYYLITLNGRDITVEPRQLQMPEGAGVFDFHTHSHFGYCAEDVHPAKSLKRAEIMGVEGLVCLEHAGQLYLSPDDFWQARHVHDPQALPAARSSSSNRMPAFRKAMRAFRSERLRVGLEAECDGDGKLGILEEDRDGWDVVLGAVHWLPDNLPARTPAEFQFSFMWLVEQMVSQDIQILAHPFRVFRPNGLRPPAELYRPMAKLLKDHHVAAEINCHHFMPDAEFFRVCAEEGTRIVLGSDAHRLDEVGDLAPHLRLLERIGLSPKDVG